VKQLTSNEIRKLFIDYFRDLDHTAVASSPLIPANDPTLLFTNAGMVQFKDTFLGLEQRSYSRAASIQRCVRAGGKHNDLENVGYTRRHHTFFEMLGNFSFGDYFKREAINFAWKFLTEILQLPKERLWVTVFKGDDESENIWLNEIKVDPKRFTRCGEKDNFWQMGDVGPCGPCTEIFYDHGPEIAGGPPGSPNSHEDRYVEIWNIVFMQYDRDADGTLKPLPLPCVDTGMGLERLAAVLQGVHDNYDIDIFERLLQALIKIIGSGEPSDVSLRVIVDHIRASAFLIADGVMPSNEGRGYVLRRIIRRAVRHGFKLGCKQAFFYRMVAPLVEVMGEAYPEIVKTKKVVEEIIKQEEEQFATTLARGLKILDQVIEDLNDKVIPGELMFQLYDTFGFPPDLTADIARERNFTVDTTGFEHAMQRQRELSQQGQQFNMEHVLKVHIGNKTEFVGYETGHAKAKITGILQDGKMPVTQLKTGEKGVIVLDVTPFYAESGGPVGDTGMIYSDHASFRVNDTQKQGDSYLHFGEVELGELKIQQEVNAAVDMEKRQAIRLNHSATHLLHAALRFVLGEHVGQKGSLVAADRLRFDFSHPKAMTAEELHKVEQLVNAQIRANHPAETTVNTPEQAKKEGAIAFFGEKYGEQVRVLKLGDFSTEICGGIHVNRTGDIGLFKIISEGATASGVRRIEALTGKAALEYVEQQQQQLNAVSEILKTETDNINHKLNQILQENRNLLRELGKYKQQYANKQIDDLSKNMVEVGDIKLLAAQVKDVDRDTLRNTLDQLRQTLGKSAIVLATVHDEKIQLVATVSPEVLPHFTAVELLNQVAHKVGGKGGGRPDMAQGGGTMPSHLAEALHALPAWAATKMAKK